MGIEAVFFDLDNVLYNTFELTQRARKNAAQMIASTGIIDATTEEILDIYTKIASKDSNASDHLNKLSVHFLGRESQAVIQAGRIGYNKIKQTMSPYPEVHRTMQFLRENNVHLGIITNGKKDKQWEKILWLNLLTWIPEDFVFISEEVGHKKPYPRIFKLAEQQLMAHLRNEHSLTSNPEIAYVGDRYETDIIGAKRAGWQAYLINRGPYAREFIENRKNYEIQPDAIINDLSYLEFLVGKRTFPVELKAE